MDKIYFLVRYIPFWAVPLFLLSLEFAYLAWMRKKKKLVLICLFFALFSIFVTSFYYWVGGPERAASFLFDLIQYYE